MIAKRVWYRLNRKTINWLCLDYEVCNLEDFQTLSALPDLLKHEERFLKYFDLHFFNNPIDSPPMYCKIAVPEALKQNDPNLLRAVDLLLDKFNEKNLSLQELSYFIHLLADLHQPFHSTRENVLGFVH